MHRDDRRPSLALLLDALSEKHPDPLSRAADRQAARDAGLGRWARRADETVDLHDEPTAIDGRVFATTEGDPDASGAVWVGFVKGEA